jgi:two-component system nitrate/nitrite response regulator NarL
LTPRERDVVRGVIFGRTNREIARELNVGEQAVKNLLSIVYQKCHVRSRLELALLAVQENLLPAGDDDDAKIVYPRGRT